MEISFDDVLIPVTPDTTYPVRYDLKLMNGVLFDIDAENYCFYSRWQKGFKKVFKQIMTVEGIQVCDFRGQDININEPPHLWIVNSVSKLVAASAESLLYED